MESCKPLTADTSEHLITRYMDSYVYALTGYACCEARSVEGLLRHGKQVTQ